MRSVQRLRSIGVIVLAFVMVGCEEVAKKMGELQPSNTPAPTTAAPSETVPPETASPVETPTPVKTTPVASNPDDPFRMIVPPPTLLYTRVVRDGIAGLEFTGKLRIESGDTSGTLYWYLEIKNRASQLIREELKFPEISKGTDIPFVFVTKGDDSAAPFLGRLVVEKDGKELAHTEFTRFIFRRTK